MRRTSTFLMSTSRSGDLPAPKLRYQQRMTVVGDDRLMLLHREAAAYVQLS